MKIPGLHHQISHRRAAAAAAAKQAAEAGDPRTRHELNLTAERLVEESEMICEQLHGDEHLLEGVLHLVAYLGASKHKSDTRKDVMSHLKAAAGLLLLEIGTPEPERHFEIVKPEQPVNGHSLPPMPETP
jgi:hypothetical protein